MLFGAAPATWSMEKCVFWVPKEVSPGEREMAQFWSPKTSKGFWIKNLPLPLTIKQTHTKRGRDLLKVTRPVGGGKAGHSLSRVWGFQGPGHYLQSSHLQPGPLGAAVRSCQRRC